MASDVAVGMATDHTGGLSSVESIVGGGFHFDAHRTYESGMPGSTFNGTAAGGDVSPGYMSVYSFKPGQWSETTRIVNGIRSMLEDVPNSHTLKLICHHEPWNNCGDNPSRTEASMGSFSDYRHMQQAVATLVDTVNAGRGDTKIRLWGCLEGDAVRAGYASDFWPGADVWTGISWDAYSWDRQYPTRYSMKDIFANPYQFTMTKGVNFAISEMSIGSKFDRRATWIRTGYRDWLTKPGTNCTWAVHWSSTSQFAFTNTELNDTYSSNIISAITKLNLSDMTIQRAPEDNIDQTILLSTPELEDDANRITDEMRDVMTLLIDPELELWDISFNERKIARALGWLP